MFGHRWLETSRRLGSIVLFAALVAQASAQAGNAPAKIGREARGALAAAGKLARVPRGTPEAQRGEILEKARSAFADVERRFATNALVVAEAAFRQGQVCGRLGRTDEAVAAFERAATRHAKAFGARARLESGHVQRRQKLYAEAVKSYRRAVAEQGGRYSDLARLWLGKTLVRLERVPDAREEWQALAADPKAEARVRIDAFDDLAMSHARAKQIEDAKRVLREAEEAFAAETAGESKEALALRKCVERMRARKSIEKAEAKQADSAKR